MADVAVGICHRMGSFLAVSRASVKPPKFIHVTYKPEMTKKKVVIIGKGLTFDSGGYNLKAGAGSMIEKMKLDMGGAAAVSRHFPNTRNIETEGHVLDTIAISCFMAFENTVLRLALFLGAQRNTKLSDGRAFWVPTVDSGCSQGARTTETSER